MVKIGSDGFSLACTILLCNRRRLTKSNPRRLE